MPEQPYDPNHDLNYEEIERFLKIAYEPHDWIEFRAIRPDQQKGTRSCYIDVARFLNNDVPATIKQWLATNHCDRYLGMYIGANPRKPRGSYGPNRSSNIEDVSTFRCAFTDLDNCNPNDAVDLYKSAGLPEPTMIVHSGRATGTHLYWRFDVEMDAETWEGVQRAIQKRLNGDAMKDPPRVMRLPGSYNFKRKNNARILREGPTYSDFSLLGLSADEMIPPTFASPAPGVEADERNLNYSTRRYMAERVPEGGNEHFDGRNNAVFSAACDFIANGFTFEDTCDRLMPLAVDRDGLPEYEAKRTIANAVNRNPTRTLLIGVNGIDETWSKYMERPQFENRGPVDPETVPEDFDSIGDMQRTVRPATDEEMTQIGIMRGDIELPTFEDETTGEAIEVDDDDASPETVAMNELSDEEAERLRYEQELADIEQFELSAPPLVCNYKDGIVEPEPGSKGKAQRVKLYRSAHQIIDDIQDGFSGWPKYAPGMGLFGYRPFGESDEIVYGLPTPASFFAFLKCVGQVRWTNEPTLFQQQTVNRELRPLKEAECFELIKERCPNRYRGFCQTPHSPPIEGFYYPKYELPEPSNGFECLNRFINALNPETETDKLLLLSALLTPAWGGPPGARPLFVLASDHGQGAGKTETVKAISSIWGGYYPLSMEKTWADNAKAMMSSDDWLTRCCLWDNVKGRFSSGEIEGAVTSEVIQGHRMYVGTVKRYNDATFFVTLNNPDMSRDLAQRAVVIKLGAPKPGNFTDWWRAFLGENRRQIIADAIAMLQREGESFDFSKFPDRWRAWQRGVLAKIPNIDLDKVMKTTRDRREEVDSETDEGEQIIRAIGSYLRAKGDTQCAEQVVSLIQLSEALEAGGLWKVDAKITPAQDARKLASFITRRCAALGVIARDGRNYVGVNDRGEPITQRAEEQTRRSPKWVFDWHTAKTRFGNDFALGVFTSSEAPLTPDAISAQDADDLGDLPV